MAKFRQQQGPRYRENLRALFPLSSRRALRVPLSRERNRNSDDRSALRPRFKRNRSLHEPCSFLHAREPQTPALPCCFDIEAFSCVDDRELNFVRVLRKLHVDVLNPTVLDRIVKGFLDDSKKGHADLGRYGTGYVNFEVDLHSLTLTKFLAPASDPGSKTEILQFCRMQLVRQRLHIVRKFCRPF